METIEAMEKTAVTIWEVVADHHILVYDSSNSDRVLTRL